ncbi:MAG: transglutaminase domain-containing protein [Armatimonadetes bacterium]|nr:transglutaminase domain-containing protein [Armatimonadota bacterium]
MLDLCRALPPNLSPQVLRLSLDVTRSCRTDEERAQALSAFFHEGFTYGKGYPFSGSSDPVEEFLLKRPPAHCEFFASGMALMLRSLGIPSRYVTGFLVQEWNGIGGYYTVRERDAHAWVEAYIPKRGWVAYDPTPPGALSGQRGGLLGRAREWLDWMSYQFQKLKAEVAGKNPKELLRLALDRLQALGRWLVEKPWRLGILFILLIAENLLGKKGALLGFFRRKEGKNSRRDAPCIARLRACLRKVDTLLESRGLIRPGHLTLLEWSREVENLLTASEARTLAIRFLDAYSMVRYGTPLPVEEDLAGLEGLATTLESSFKDS